MPKEPLSLFHEHLIHFLQEDLKEKKCHGGWDESNDPEVRRYRDHLSRVMRNAEPLELHQILDRYKHLFEKRGPVHLELKMLEAFGEKEMKQLGLPPFYMHRGLPRMYRKSEPALFSKIHPAYAHLPALKRRALNRVLFSLYQSVEVSAQSVITLLVSTEYEKGVDLSKDVEEIIQSAFPTLQITIYHFASPSKKQPDNSNWEGSASQWEQIQRSVLLLQIGEDNQVLSSLFREMKERGIVKNRETFLRHSESSQSLYHVDEQALCTGFHFLEAGELFLKLPEYAMLESKELKEQLFAQTDISLSDRALYRKKKRFFWADLNSSYAVRMYLEALSVSLKNDSKEIELFFPRLDGLFSYLEEERSSQGDLLRNGKIRRIEIVFDSFYTSIPFRQKGKTIRIHSSAKSISRKDRRWLIQWSEDFVGCSSESELSDAISCNKGFFFDADNEHRYFLQDLLALAESRIPTHQSTLKLLRLFPRAVKKGEESQKCEWIDELSMQEMSTDHPKEVGLEMGEILQDRDTLIGFKRLNRLITEEYSANALLVQMIQRAVFQQMHPCLAEKEQELVFRFIHNRLSLKELVLSLKEKIPS